MPRVYTPPDLANYTQSLPPRAEAPATNPSPEHKNKAGGAMYLVQSFFLTTKTCFDLLAVLEGTFLKMVFAVKSCSFDVELTWVGTWWVGKICGFTSGTPLIMRDI